MKKGWKRSCRNEFFLSGRRGTTWKKLCTLDSFLILLEIYNNTPKFKFIQIQIIQSRVSSPNDKFLPRTGPAKHTKEVRHARYDEAQPIIYFKKKTSTGRPRFESVQQAQQRTRACPPCRGDPTPPSPLSAVGVSLLSQATNGQDRKRRCDRIGKPVEPVPKRTPLASNSSSGGAEATWWDSTRQIPTAQVPQPSSSIGRAIRWDSAAPGSDKFVCLYRSPDELRACEWVFSLSGLGEFLRVLSRFWLVRPGAFRFCWCALVRWGREWWGRVNGNLGGKLGDCGLDGAGFCWGVFVGV
jgi:hypothetical protein